MYSLDDCFTHKWFLLTILRHWLDHLLKQFFLYKFIYHEMMIKHLFKYIYLDIINGYAYVARTIYLLTIR